MSFAFELYNCIIDFDDHDFLNFNVVSLFDVKIGGLTIGCTAYIL